MTSQTTRYSVCYRFEEVSVVKRLSSLPEQRTNILLELDNNIVVNLARNLDSAALSSFGGYL